MNLDTGFLFEADRSAPTPAPALHDRQVGLDSVRAAALAGTLQQLIDDLPEQIAVLDTGSNILAVNRAWAAVVAAHGYSGASAGDNYREFCATSAAEGYEPAVEAVQALTDISSGRRSYWQLIYNGGERWDHRDFQIVVNRTSVDGQNLILVTRFDLTEILELRRFREEFSNSLLEQQTIERQRLGRELHDSTAQLLVAIELTLGRLKPQLVNEEALGLIDELRELVGEAQQDIRSISYLAHPPSLEKLGLTDALTALVEGFARRTSLEASFEIQGPSVPVPAEVERTIYRIAQEALSNVHRHARAKRARLLLCFRPAAAHFMIVDDGTGICGNALGAKACAGVGLSSMRSRLREIGGRLSIRRLQPGTAVVASVRLGRTFSDPR